MLTAARRKYQRDWYHSHRDVERKRRQARITKRRRELKKYLDDLKLESGCYRCGFKEHPAALEFHHKNPLEKSFEIGRGRVMCFSLERLKKEIEKCLIICANCHAIIHN